MTDDMDYPYHSAGIGQWGVMGGGSIGWLHNRPNSVIFDGPNPMSAWSRIFAGWITPDTVSEDMLGVQIHDINSSEGKVLKIPVLGSSTEYFLVANRQNTHSETKSTTMVGGYYDDYAPASGLAIWHVDEDITGNTPNNNELHKLVDLECADGLFSDKGYAPDDIPNNPDPVSGGDNLDYVSVASYMKNGNFGDTTDVWNGLADTRLRADTLFTPHTNPSTYGYDGDRQSVFSGIAVRDISQSQTNGVMSFNIHFIPDAPTVSGNPMQGTGDDWNQVTLSFTAPDVNNAVISGYQYSIDNGDSWHPNPNSNSTWFSAPTTGEGMRTGTISLPTDDNTVKYTFQVRAVTANNEQGEAAAWSSFILDRPGTVALSDLTTPKVGDQLTATLTDANGGISGQRWQWERTDEDADEGWTSIGTDMNSYELAEEDVGEQVRATVTYTDSHGPNKSAASDPTASVVDVPPTPDLEAVAGDEQVELTWSAPLSDGGSPILRYHVRYYKADLSDQAEAEWDVVPGGAAAQDTTIEELANSTAYVFQVLAENAVGRGAWAEAEATPKAPRCSIAGPFAATVAENTPTTKAVATYAFSGNGCGAARWLALDGTDASAFALQGSGTARTLHFLSAPDYEAKRSYVVTVRILWGFTATYHPVRVTVSNVNEEGSVALSSTAPQVDHPVTATLTDPDGQITGASWTWQREEGSTWVTVWPSGASGTAAESYSELSSYTPQTADIGHRLQARVSYRDPSSTDEMDFRSAESDTTASVVDVPPTPDLEAVAGDEQVELTWSAPSSDGGSPILRYHVRYYKADLSDQAEAEWDVVPGGAAAQDTTIKELTNGTAYVFQVVAENAVGRGVPAEKEATPKAPRCSIAGPFAATVAENTPTTEAVATYAFSGNGCGAARWLALDGTDARAFALQGSGTARTLHFLSAPDYEAKRSYVVTVRILWGFTATYHPVRVTVSNVEEEGKVAFIGGLPPQEDRAVVAQLTDPDGQITGASWTWQRRSSASSSWEAVSSGASGTSETTGTASAAELSRYKPLAQDVGWQIRASVAYTDGQGPNKSQQSDPTAAVIGKPGKPQDLEADPGDEQVALSWSAPASDGGSSITGYAYRYSDDGGTTWERDWPTQADGTTTSTVVDGLTNETTYTFQVRAHNNIGAGPAAEETATPKAPVCSITGPTAATVAENTPTTTAVGTYTLSGKDCGVAVWLTLGGTDQSAFQLQGSGTARTLHFLAAPDYETKNSYEVKVRVQVGSEERSVAATVSVSNMEEEGTVAFIGGLPPQEDRAVVAQLTDPDGQITGASWTWQRRSSATSSWEAVSSGASGTSETTGTASAAELSRYKPQAQDVGWQIRATVAYTDGQGPNKSRQSDPTAAVLGKPGKPQDLEADPGDEQVALSWSAPASDGGSRSPAMPIATATTAAPPGSGTGQPRPMGPPPARWSMG